MARRVSRGELWMYAFAPLDKERPVLVLSRQAVIPLLRTVMVAPVTSAIHGVPSEVVVGVEHGLKHPSAVNLDHVQTVDRSRLKRYVGRLDDAMMARVCESLAIAVGCDRPRAGEPSPSVDRAEGITRRKDVGSPRE